MTTQSDGNWGKELCLNIIRTVHWRWREMKYYFNTKYANMAISTEGAIYIFFKRSCDFFSSDLSEREFSFGEWSCFDKSSFSVEYWKEYNKSSVTLIDEEKIRRVIEGISQEDIMITGAGLSNIAGIPTQKELEDSLFLNDPLELFKCCMKDPNRLINILRFFYCRLSVAKPTIAHYKIKLLQDQKNFVVATENLDLLHEKSGVEAIHIPQSVYMLENICYKRAFLIGVGNPCCQSFLKELEESGTAICAVSITKPNLDVKNFMWYPGSIESIFDWRQNV